MKASLILMLTFLSLTVQCIAQVGFKPDGSRPHSSGSSVISPATGLILYDIPTNLRNYFNGSGWVVPCATSTGIMGAAGSQASFGLAINTTNPSTHHSAILDVASTYKGMLITRITTVQRNAILPVTGLAIYNTTANTIEFFDGTAWFQLITNVLDAPAKAPPVPSGSQIVWKWKTAPGATGYKWNTISDYTSAVDMGTDTTKTETGLTPGNTYERLIWAHDPCGVSTPTILNGCSAAVFAARLCDELVMGRCSDWYLPSKDEPGEMFLQKTIRS